ncbi:MAG: TIGR02710 family CRISPR-associated protein [Thermus sp.]|uniref:TIGR02710 family CRISPR-associated CARF protein n=1 Tax=Thermus sp. TaxID=275 RepID=UPI003331139A
MKTLILTVGTSRPPLEEALAQHAPQGVIFIASQKSFPVAGELVKEYGEALKHHTLILEDEESLEEAYKKALEALKKALEWEATAIVADFSGGTKPMAAGLVLALTGRGVTFSYVGGRKRDPETGRVLSGHEQLRLLEDPTARYGLREWEGFVRNFNALNLPAAISELDALLKKPLSPSEVRFYGALKGVTEGLLHWDRFWHERALEALNTHLDVALAVAEAWGHGAKVRVLKELEGARENLKTIVEKGKRPTFALLADLLANADRRFRVGRYDDALARLYRGLELAAQADLYERLGIDLKDTQTFPKEFPEGLRETALRTRGLAEVLDVSFNIDLFYNQSGTLAQRLYSDFQGRLQPLLKKRHESILGHGTNPVKKEDYEKFRAYFDEMGLKALPPWPAF